MATNDTKSNIIFTLNLSILSLIHDKKAYDFVFWRFQVTLIYVYIAEFTFGVIHLGEKLRNIGG